MGAVRKVLSTSLKVPVRVNPSNALRKPIKPKGSGSMVYCARNPVGDWDLSMWQLEALRQSIDPYCLETIRGVYTDTATVK